MVQRSAEANAAFVRGDVRGCLAPIGHADDHTPMAPFGGAPTRGFDASPGRLADPARYLRRGASEQEPVQAYASGGLAVLVTIERRRGEAGGLPEQGWPLRVTQVFRREGSGRLLAHRHADPPARNTGLERAAAIARG